MAQTYKYYELKYVINAFKRKVQNIYENFLNETIKHMNKFEEIFT